MISDLKCSGSCALVMSMTLANLTPVSRCNRSNCDLGCLPKRNSAEDCPVVVWGVLELLSPLTHLRQGDAELCVCVCVCVCVIPINLETHHWWRLHHCLLQSSLADHVFKNDSPFLYGCKWSSRINRDDIHPLRMGIYLLKPKTFNRQLGLHNPGAILSKVF